MTLNCVDATVARKDSIVSGIRPNSVSVPRHHWSPARTKAAVGKVTPRWVACVDYIVADVPGEEIAACPTNQAINAGPTIDGVVSFPRVDDVVSETRIDEVVPAAGRDPIIAATGENRVPTIGPREHVIARRTRRKQYEGDGESNSH